MLEKFITLSLSQSANRVFDLLRCTHVQSLGAAGEYGNPRDRVTLLRKNTYRMPGHRARLVILRCELELFSRNTAELEETDQCFFDQVVRAGCAGGDADDGGTAGQPES